MKVHTTIGTFEGKPIRFAIEDGMLTVLFANREYVHIKVSEVKNLTRLKLAMKLRPIKPLKPHR